MEELDKITYCKRDILNNQTLSFTIIAMSLSKFSLLYNFSAKPKRLLGFRVADTGMDPIGNYQNFIKHDVIQNIDVHRDNQEIKAVND